MKAFRALGAAAFVCALACLLSLGPPATASSITTDQSDLWWIHTESGWGMQIVQQEATMFATLFVYGPDGQPAWYSATLSYQGVRAGAPTWTGTLYKTTGPWFGTAVFDPAAVTATSVGSMSFSGPLVNSATLVYTVNGVQVTKTIERQVLVHERYSGAFAGVMSQKGTGSNCDPAANIPGTPVNVQIAQNTGATNPETRFVVTSSRDTCTYIGPYTQGGHFGFVVGNYSCAAGDNGTFTFGEMVRNVSDMRVRTIVTTKAGCTLNGIIVGILQP